MKNRTLRALAMTLVLLFTLAACKSNGSSGSTPSAQPASTGGTSSQDAAADSEPAPASLDWKVALLTSGPVNDNDWNAMAYGGLQQIEEAYGVETGYVESVTQSDQEEVMRSFIDEGYNVIYGHGYEFGDAMKKLADEFPNVNFVITSAEVVNGTNLASCNISAKEHGFMAGVAAALVSEAGHVTMLGSMEMPPIVAALEGFELGAKYINPDIKVDTDLIGSYDDAAKAKELMTAYINQGANVGSFNADMAAMGGLEAIVEADKLCIGVNFNQGEIAPDNVVTNIGQSYPNAMENVFKHMVDGTFEGVSYNEGIATGAIYLIPNPEYDVPEEVQSRLDEVLAAAAAGEIEELKE